MDYLLKTQVKLLLCIRIKKHISPLRKVISLKTTTIKNGKNKFFFQNSVLYNDIELREKNTFKNINGF